MMLMRPVRTAFLAGLIACAAACNSSPTPQAAHAAAAKVKALAAQCQGDGQALKPGKPLWVENGKLTRRGRDLLRQLATLRQDGLNPRDYLPGGQPSEQGLSDSLVRVAGDLAQPPPGVKIDYVDDPLRPARPCAGAVLNAVSTSSLDTVLRGLRQPNGAAAVLWRALQAAKTPQERSDLARDLALARSIGPAGKALLVDTNSAQLWEVAGTAIAGRMKVVVGMKVKGDETPPLAALIRWADVNPYWYVPPDLVQQGIAHHVLAQGLKYLQQHRYEAVDSYDDDDAHALNAASVNWPAVESGKSDVGVRQLPGPDNMLGRVAFVFPNDYGIYLHDTPGRWVFSAPDRHLSHGCVRLENAAALFRFVFGVNLPAPNPNDPDDEYDPKQPVPVYIVPLSAEGAAALSAGVGANPEPHVKKFLGIKIDDDVFAEVQNAVRSV
jgi:murein L,D-transpeptidase YcbB/YkuD